LLGSRTSLIDANGVIMGPPAGRQNAYRFPVIRGMTESEALSTRAAAMKIYNRLMHELDSGDDAGQHFTRQLSEVDLSDAEDVKATVSDDAGTVLIHLGDSDFLERYKLYAAHIREWRRQYHNVQSVDLRYEGQIIVNPDGERAQQPELPAPSKPAVQPKPAMSHAVHASARHKRQRSGRRSRWARTARTKRTCLGWSTWIAQKHGRAFGRRRPPASGIAAMWWWRVAAPARE